VAKNEYGRNFVTYEKAAALLPPTVAYKAIDFYQQ
jgi:hypothetical protein